MGDPRPDLEDQQKAALADEKPKAEAVDGKDGSSSGDSGAREATIVDTKLNEYLESDEYRNDHIGNYATIVNPDGSPAIHASDAEGQAEQDAKELAEEEAWKAKLSPEDQARLEPGLANVDYADLFAAAAEGDPVSRALTGDITDGVPLVEIERQLQLGVANPDDVHALLKVRQNEAELDLGKALGGDADAWIRFNQNVNGTTPTPKELEAFLKAGGPSLASADHHFQMLGIDTRPQPMLDRLAELQADLTKAGMGDIQAALGLADGLGIEHNRLINPDGSVNIDALDGAKSLLAGLSDHQPGTDVGIPGKNAIPLDPTPPEPINLGTATDASQGPSASGDTMSTTSGFGTSGGAGLHDMGGGGFAGGPSSSGSGGDAPTGGAQGGSDGGDPMPTHDDPDPGTSADTGGDDGGDPMPPEADDPDAGSFGDAVGGGGDESGDGSGTSAPVGVVTAGEPEIESGTFFTGGETSDHYEYPSGATVDIPHDSGGSSGGNQGGSDDGGGSGGSGGSSGGGSDGGTDDGSGGGTDGGTDSGGASGGASGGGAADDDDDGTEYVDNDPGGYSNLSVGGEQAAAYLEQRLVREGGDQVQPGSQDQAPAGEIPTTATLDYTTHDAASTTGGTLTTHAAPIDFGNPLDAEGTLTFSGENPRDPSIYSSGGATAGTGADMGTGAPAAYGGPSGGPSQLPFGGAGQATGGQDASDQGVPTGTSYASTAASTGDVVGTSRTAPAGSTERAGGEAVAESGDVGTARTAPTGTTERAGGDSAAAESGDVGTARTAPTGSTERAGGEAASPGAGSTSDAAGGGVGSATGEPAASTETAGAAAGAAATDIVTGGAAPGGSAISEGAGTADASGAGGAAAGPAAGGSSGGAGAIAEDIDIVTGEPVGAKLDLAPKVEVLTKEAFEDQAREEKRAAERDDDSGATVDKEDDGRRREDDGEVAKLDRQRDDPLAAKLDQEPERFDDRDDDGGDKGGGDDAFDDDSDDGDTDSGDDGGG